MGCRNALYLILIFAMVTFSMSGTALAELVDDFESYAIGYIPPNWSVYQGVWEILEDFDGNRVLCFNDADTWGAIRYDLGNTWTNYAVRVDANLEYTLFGSYFAIGGRLNSIGGGYWLRRSLEADGTIELCRAADYSEPSSKSLGWYPLPVDGKRHTFVLDFQGSDIRAYVDGVKRIEATDSTYSFGSIGLKSDIGCLTQFDNLYGEQATVPEPSSFVMFSGGFLAAAGILRRRALRR